MGELAGTHNKPTAVWAAIIANMLIAIVKFIAASVTGSSAMLSEGIHSIVDTGDGVLILLGVRRARRAPDREHPFGHGKELYFWTLIVAVLIFAVGGGMSVYEGISHLQNPHHLEDPFWNYLVLGIVTPIEGTSFIIATREIWKKKKIHRRSLLAQVRASKDPTLFTVFFEDAAALAGLLVAFLGVWLGHLFNSPLFDGLASILIGLLLMSVATALVIESKGLLIGESADPMTLKGIRQVIEGDHDVVRILDLLTMHLGPHEILLNVAIVFKEGLQIEQIVAAIDRIEDLVRKCHPEVRRIFIEADSLTHASARQDGKTLG